MAQTKKEETMNTEAKTVRIMLPIGEDMEDDVWVCINGKSYLMQRGKEIEVPKEVAEVLNNSSRMKREAFDRKRKLQESLKTIR